MEQLYNVKREKDKVSMSRKWAWKMTTSFKEGGMLQEEFLTSVVSKIQDVIDQNQDLLKKAKDTPKKSPTQESWVIPRSDQLERLTTIKSKCDEGLKSCKGCEFSVFKDIMSNDPEKFMLDVSDDLEVLESQNVELATHVTRVDKTRFWTERKEVSVTQLVHDSCFEEVRSELYKKVREEGEDGCIKTASDNMNFVEKIIKLIRSVVERHDKIQDIIKKTRKSAEMEKYRLEEHPKVVQWVMLEFYLDHCAGLLSKEMKAGKWEHETGLSITTMLSYALPEFIHKGYLRPKGQDHPIKKWMGITEALNDLFRSLKNVENDNSRKISVIDRFGGVSVECNYEQSYDARNPPLFGLMKDFEEKYRRPKETHFAHFIGDSSTQIMKAVQENQDLWSVAGKMPDVIERMNKGSLVGSVKDNHVTNTRRHQRINNVRGFCMSLKKKHYDNHKDIGKVSKKLLSDVVPGGWPSFKIFYRDLRELAEDSMALEVAMNLCKVSTEAKMEAMREREVREDREKFEAPGRNFAADRLLKMQKRQSRKNQSPEVTLAQYLSSAKVAAYQHYLLKNEEKGIPPHTAVKTENDFRKWMSGDRRTAKWTRSNIMLLQKMLSVGFEFVVAPDSPAGGGGDAGRGQPTKTPVTVGEETKSRPNMPGCIEVMCDGRSKKKSPKKK